MGIFRMLKWMVGLVFLLLLAAVAAVVGYFQIDRIAKQAIERGGTYAMGTPTHVESANLSLRSGELALTRLRIENPAGFTDPLFLEVERGEVAMDVRSLLSRQVRISRLHLDTIAVHLEDSSEGANYQKIVENLEKLRESLPSVPGDEKTYVIDEIILRDITVFAATRRLAFLRPLRVTIDELKLVDVGSDSPEGLMMGQVQGVIVRAILQAILGEVGGILSPSVAAALEAGSGHTGTVQGIRVEGMSADDIRDSALRGLESIFRRNE